MRLQLSSSSHLPTALCLSGAHLSSPREKARLVFPLGELLRGRERTVRWAQAVFSPYILKLGTGKQSASKYLLAAWWEQVCKSTRNYRNVKPFLSREWYLLKGRETIKFEYSPFQDIIRLFHSFPIKFRSLSTEISKILHFLLCLSSVWWLEWTRRAILQLVPCMVLAGSKLQRRGFEDNTSFLIIAILEIYYIYI